MNADVFGPSERGYLANTIPMVAARMGSWQISIRRQVHPRKELAKRYDLAAADWTKTTERYQLVAKYRSALVQSRIAGRLANKDRAIHVLDCGVGTGALTRALHSTLPRSAEFTGVDTSKDMLVNAATVLQTAGIRSKLDQADILSLPYEDASFDFVMAAHVIEHLPDPMRGIQEMKRVLKPGGHVFLCVTRPSLFGAFIQMRWRTWTVSSLQGVTWLRESGMSNIGLCPVALGSRAGEASTAFWARKRAAI